MDEAKQKFRLTSLERAWILYDVGNSAFVLLVATLIPIFFNALAEGGGLSSVEYLAYWGYAASAVTVITAVLGPILGTLADTRNYKKPIFTFCVAVGVMAAAPWGWQAPGCRSCSSSSLPRWAFRAVWCSMTPCSAM